MVRYMCTKCGKLTNNTNIIIDVFNEAICKNCFDINSYEKRDEKEP